MSALVDQPYSAGYFAERRDRADFAAFDLIMPRSGGESPLEDDEIG